MYTSARVSRLRKCAPVVYSCSPLGAHLKDHHISKQSDLPRPNLHRDSPAIYMNTRKKNVFFCPSSIQLSTSCDCKFLYYKQEAASIPNRSGPRAWYQRKGITYSS